MLFDTYCLLLFVSLSFSPNNLRLPAAIDKYEGVAKTQYILQMPLLLQVYET
jgi:hypothetical protein